jgi:hypothetical protein
VHVLLQLRWHHRRHPLPHHQHLHMCIHAYACNSIIQI